MTSDSAVALGDLWREAGGDASALHRVNLTGEEPALPSSFRVGSAAQVSIAASALAVSEFARVRGLGAPEVSVDMRHAAIEFRSERYQRVYGAPPENPWDPLAGAYRCGDGRWLRVHTNFAHHRDGLLAMLSCDTTREAVAAALAQRPAAAVEDGAAARGLVVAMMRDFAEWDAHPQGRAVADLPPVSLTRIGVAPPQTPRPADRPLGGVRVLDLTRVIAGPVAGRTLAAHGADVMRISASHLPSIPGAVIDTGRGKLSARLDLRDPAGRAALNALAAEADVFLQAYRPGALTARGFGPDALAASRPGIVYAELSAYGPTGPWRDRRGFDSLVQTASGFNHAEAEASGADGPRALPCQALDHASGYLLAFGIVMALIRRATEGGSWHVGVSLAATAHWLRGLGRVEDGFAAHDPADADVADLLETSDSPFGRITAVRHAGRLAGFAPFWQRPTVPLGTHAPRWPA